jgi:hypothetical protein
VIAPNGIGAPNDARPVDPHSRAMSSGFGRELTRQLLEHGDRMVGTVRG